MKDIAIVVYNQKSGLGDTHQQVEEGMQNLSEHYEIVRLQIKDVLNGQSFAKRVREQTPRILIAIGGDGTVNACAHQAVRHQIKLAVVPAGTFNHFAKHHDIPLTIPDAFFTIHNGKTELIDTATVNERTFVNFASIGFYADTIASRTQQQRLGGKKWFSFFRALLQQFFIYRIFSLRFMYKDEEVTKRTPFVFVGNGRFTFGSLDLLAQKDKMQAGKLHLALMKECSRWYLLLLAFLALFSDIINRFGLQSYLLSQLTIETRKNRRAKVTLDGEVVKLKSPYAFAARPLSLKLVVPKD